LRRLVVVGVQDKAALALHRPAKEDEVVGDVDVGHDVQPLQQAGDG